MNSIKSSSGLRNSRFRSRFKLRAREHEYLNRKGLDVILDHGKDFIEQAALRQQIRTMTAGRRRCATTQFLWHSTRQPHAAAVVSKSGTASLEGVHSRSKSKAMY